MVRPAQLADIPALVGLSERKRTQYQQYSPTFWHKAVDSREKQLVFFEHLMKQDDVLLFVFEVENDIAGFVIASLVKAPPVYDPQGLVCTIDDYCVADENNWQDVGIALLNEAKREAKERGAVLVLVVCGHLDVPKRTMLASSGFTIASEWYVQDI